MSEVDTRYAYMAANLAQEACDLLNLDPHQYVRATDHIGVEGEFPRWMVVAEQMRRFDIFAKMHDVGRSPR